MHRQILIACLPSLIALAIAFALLHAVLRFSGGRFRLARLRDLNRCEAGGVQSLAFVLTLPLFLMVVMFIAQIGLMMVAQITVNTAAFAAARSAAVWIPAYVDDEENQNHLTGLDPERGLRLDAVSVRDSPKRSKIFDAAVLACVPIAPSRAIISNDQSLPTETPTVDADDLFGISSALVPSWQSDTKIPLRLRNKLTYSVQNTWVDITFVDKNSGRTDQKGPTYNPYDHPLVGYEPSEVGWQDPVTIAVWHRYALLPGAGRFLASSLRLYTGQPDEIADSILQEPGVQKIWLHGSATLTVEGIKSVHPYEQQP